MHHFTRILSLHTICTKYDNSKLNEKLYRMLNSFIMIMLSITKCNQKCMEHEEKKNRSKNLANYEMFAAHHIRAHDS